ncbi:hypothetical protein ACWEQN_42040 [Streptomyces sp. NPDC004129]|uniref:hypothetical protein n=1 Tax=Streptomyces sp. NPDC004533 TaxID=3154278 RepID=UPI0033AD74C9
MDCETGDDTYTAMHPRYPAMQMVRQLADHMNALTAFTERLPEFVTDILEASAVSRKPNASIQHLVGRQLINEHITREHGGVRKEIISAQPGHRSREDLAFSYERDRNVLKQGLPMRTLYHSLVRRVATVGAWARNMSDAGAEIRTLNGRFPRSIVFDRRVAFVPAQRGGAEPSPDEAVMITDPYGVGRIVDVFDMFWERAQPWYGGTRGDDKGLLTTPTQRAILRELCLGRTQAQAAKNLGIGSAWINEQLGQLRKKLGVHTLNEVIYWWAMSPDHEVAD